MDKGELITKVKEQEETCRQAHPIDQSFYEELLEDYALMAWALMSVGDSYPWEEMLLIQDRLDEIAKLLPNVSDEVFDEYIYLGDLMAVLQYPI